MDALDLLVRGTLGLAAAVAVVILARVRLTGREDTDAPADIGLD